MVCVKYLGCYLFLGEFLVIVRIFDVKYYYCDIKNIYNGENGF